ncbi:hypothetical protein VTI28DRAFT_292 [Corynascus sepedonium]
MGIEKWIDFDNDYKSMDLKFMESCWWVFKQLFDKGAVYRAYQIMSYSTALCTPLSQMEAKQNEKMTQDPAILVSFPLIGVEGKEDTSLVVYTTTPWTLPSNLFITVNPNFDYIEVLDEKTNQRYIMLETGLSMLYKDLMKAKSSPQIMSKLARLVLFTRPRLLVRKTMMPPLPPASSHLEATNWVPQFVRDKSFANWIANVHDWNVSRNRYWKTPIPLWVSDDYEEIVCVGSVEELMRLSGFDGPLDDIHRDKVDGITIPSKQGKGVLRRVEEIFDCWFESGSMPYASNHSPFENSERFYEGLFPADFIAEGLDQTRGWFYTLTVLGNKLFDTSPFKNVIVNGIVLAEDGKKMSKSLKNYPDPSAILNQYGSDALRLYLVNSPIVRAESMRFKESGAKEIVARILADCQSLLRFVEEEMRGYRLYTVVPRLLQVIDNLTNWYIRFNRKRLKGVAGLGQDDTTAALNTLLQVLFTMVRALAPFIPFLTEHIYQLLRPQLSSATAEFADTRSVHFLPFPTVHEALFDEVIERQMSVMQKVIQLGRVARERRNLSLKTPLLSLVVVADRQALEDIETLKSYVLEELNVRNIVLTDDEEQYNIVLEARVDWPSLGKNLKKDVQVVRKALPNLTQAQLREYQRTKTMNLDGIALGEGDLTLVRVIRQSQGYEEADSGKSGGPQWEPAFSDDMIVLLDAAPHSELVQEGLVRELINRFQRLRKKAGLVPTDEVHMRLRVISDPEGVGFGELVTTRQDKFVAALRGRVEEVEEGAEQANIILEEEQTVGDAVVMLQIARI